MTEDEIVVHLIERHGERRDVADWRRASDRGGRPLADFHEFRHRPAVDHALDDRGAR